MKSIGQRILKILERTFLREQVKKREQQQLQEKEHYNQGETPIREKRSLLNRLRGRLGRRRQIIGTAPVPEHYY